jgi:ATP:ADP antiporter, AAA family
MFRRLWKGFFDVRAGEYLRTIFMALYLMFVLFAYYILKPVSRALFLNQFDIDKLPYLYILIAVGGGILAYLYTKLAVKSSLKVAVGWSTALTAASLVGLWWLIGLGLDWVLYLFNVFVSLFSVVLVSQGWLVAANVFDSRQAKRLYGLLGMGAVIGAAFGGTFTAQTVKIIGPRHLLLASAVMVLLAYGAFWMVTRQKGVTLAGARAADSEEAEFQFRDILGALANHRHLQVITGIILLTFIVDVTIEYQFNAMAKLAYPSKTQLTAFLGNFYGLWLNLVTFSLQFFLTAAVVRWFGVGGTLQIMPVTISATALVTFFLPGVQSSAGLRLTEAATRYTLNRTGMELLYLPLPTDLKNRTKAFVDIFVDRMGRGLGGMILVLCTTVLALAPKYISLVTIGFSLLWILLATRASREYVATVRRRLASRRLDIGSARLSVGDPETLALLQQTALGENPRQAAYALGLLADTQDRDLQPLLTKLAESPAVEMRAKVFDLARAQNYGALLDRALGEVYRQHSNDAAPAVRAAVSYALTVSSDAPRLLYEFLELRDPAIWEGAMDAVLVRHELARDVITRDWIAAAARDPDFRRRALAARAVEVSGDEGIEALHRLLEDADPRVVAAACRAAGALRNRGYVYAMVQRLSDVRVRGVAIEALSAYGPAICGTLGDLLSDNAAPLAVRKEIPRVLRLIAHQRSVDILLAALYHPNATLRHAALKALNRLRESAPQLQYADELVAVQIHQEARQYFELNAALGPFREGQDGSRAATLLARTIEERLRQTLERLFRLLGLRYPPREIYSAYLGVSRRGGEQYSAALEFLDNVLERDLKRVLLPLLDAPGHVLETGRHLFGIEVKTAETAIRDLIRSGDPWLVACAVAAAADLGMRRLAPDIRQAAENTGPDVAEVARAAAAALAA